MNLVFRLSLVFVALLLPLQSAHAEKEPIRLNASTDWYVSYEDDSCRLGREFGEGKEKIIIRMIRFGPGHDFRLTIAGQPVKMNKSRKRYRIRFGEHEPYQKVSFGIGKLGELPALIGFNQMGIGSWQHIDTKTLVTNDGEELSYSHYDISEDRYAAARDIYVDLPYRKTTVLVTGSLAKPFAAFDTCVNKLMEDWGIDVERHKNRAIAPRPVSSPARWMKSSDYPKEMLRKGQPGLVNFRLSVDKAGKVTDCHIQETTRPQAFDDAVCNGFMKRSVFYPALDREGQPMASYYRNSVRFQIGF